MHTLESMGLSGDEQSATGRHRIVASPSLFSHRYGLFRDNITLFEPEPSHQARWNSLSCLIEEPR